MSKEDAWGTRQTSECIVKYNPLVIRNKYAGAGKSHVAHYFSNTGFKILFVVPRNNLSQHVQDDAVTTNKSFSTPVGDGGKVPEFDHCQYYVM